MLIIYFVIFPILTASVYTDSQNYPGKDTSTKTSSRLSRPLVGDDGRVYICSDKNLFAFERNGSIAWALHLPFTCNVTMPPVLAGRGKIYLIAENRVLDVSFPDFGPSPPAVEVFFGPEKGQKGAGELIGIAVSTLSSSLFINIKNRGLFAYLMRGQLQWSVGPVLSQFGYSVGCRKGVTDCYFASVPVIDKCENSIYISNTAGEVYSLSLASPHFNWVQDLSSFGKEFSITPANNGLLYVTVPLKAIILALHVSVGNVLWQTSIGPLSTTEYQPVVDSNGWMSIGSLDGYLYSISPTGEVKKFAKASESNHVIQVSPFLDCSGYAIYISQAEMEGKVSHKIGEYNYVSAMRPKGVVFTLLVPATGAIYWSESYPGQFLSLLSQSDLKNFALDEGILLAFVAATGAGNPLPCRSNYEKLVSTCSQARPKHLKIYTGNQKVIVLFLLFESIVLIVLAGLVRFCCIFWSKKKLQNQDLGIFLEKRRSLQQKKKELDRTIMELEKRAAEEALANEITEELGNLVLEKQGIERKLSTSYSLGRDQTSLKSKSILPVYDGKSRSYSFQSGKKESFSLFHTSSDTPSSAENISEGDSSSWELEEEPEIPIKESDFSSDDDGDYITPVKASSSDPASSSLQLNPMFAESTPRTRSRTSIWLKRRTLSSTN